jgi:hypothetical protein
MSTDYHRDNTNTEDCYHELHEFTRIIHFGLFYSVVPPEENQVYHGNAHFVSSLISLIR